MATTKSLDGVLTKKAHQREKFDEAGIEELKKCIDPDSGYLYFCQKFFHIQHPVDGKVMFDPFGYQERLLESYHNHRFNINMLPRQSGKTTTAAAYLLWYAMFHPDQTILIAAHKYTGAQEIMQRIRYGYELCPDTIRAGVTNYNKGSMEFENGSRIVSATTTGNTGRGMSISLLYCDEFAFVNPSIADEFWTSISPTLATGGRAIITSTPNSDEDTFAIIWKESQNKFDEEGFHDLPWLAVFWWKRSFSVTAPAQGHPLLWRSEALQPCRRPFLTYVVQQRASTRCGHAARFLPWRRWPQK